MCVRVCVCVGVQHFRASLSDNSNVWRTRMPASNCNHVDNNMRADGGGGGGRAKKEGSQIIYVKENHVCMVFV